MNPISQVGISVGGGHCCVCTGVCGHIGGPFYCQQHDPRGTAPSMPAYPFPSVPLITVPVYPDIDRSRADEAFRERLRERMEADQRLLERMERIAEGPVDWRAAWSAEAAKFQAETITTSFLATRLRDGRHTCDHCGNRVGQTVVVGVRQVRGWVCEDCDGRRSAGSEVKP